MLTGGFRSRLGAEAAIKDGACDLVGIARPAAVDPKFPLLLLDEKVADEDAKIVLNKAPIPWYAKWLPRNLIGAGAESVSLLSPSGLGNPFAQDEKYTNSYLFLCIDILCRADSKVGQGSGDLCTCSLMLLTGVCIAFIHRYRGHLFFLVLFYLIARYCIYSSAI